MAEIRGIFQSPFFDEPRILRNPQDDPEEIKNSGFFAYHDIHAASMIIGINKGEAVGADIYEVSGVSRDPREAFADLPNMITSENVTQTIGFYGRSREIPMTTDEGETGMLTIVHMPLIRLAKIIYVPE